MDAPPLVSTAGGTPRTVMDAPPLVSTAGGTPRTVMDAPPLVSTAGGTPQTVMDAPPLVSTAGGTPRTVMDAPPLVSTAGGTPRTVMDAPPLVPTADGTPRTVMDAPPLVSTAGGTPRTVMDVPPLVSTAGGTQGTVMDTPPVVSAAGGTQGTVMKVPPVASTASLTSLSQGRAGPLTKQDENVLKYFVMLRRMGPAGTTLAKVCQELYGGGQQNVKDYINSLGFSNRQYRKIFSADELDALAGGTDWGQLDITFLYKLLQHVCGLAPPQDHKWANPDPQNTDGLEHILFSVKCERNFLFHEAVGLTDTDLEARSEKLKSLLEKALEKAGVITGDDYTREITEMKIKIDDIHQSRTKLSLQDYQNELQEFRQKLVREVIFDSQRELRQNYLKSWQEEHVCGQVIPESRRVPLEEVFTKITVLTRKNCEVPVSDILDYQFSGGSRPRLVIVEGIAGVGKSQLCKYILHCWAAENSKNVALTNVDIIIFFQCHSVSSSSLREFFTEEILQDTCKGLRHEDVIPTLRECGILFIIDGLDEAGAQARNLLKEVNAKFPASRLVVTCRPEFTREAKWILSSQEDDFIILNAKGFNNTQQREYIDKLLIVMEGNSSKRQERIETLLTILQNLEHELHFLLSLPLSLTMVMELWLVDSASLTGAATLTHILQKSVDLGIKLLVQRLQRKPQETRPIFLLKHACQLWLKCLARVARESLSCNTLVLNERWTTNLIEEACRRDIDPSYAMSSFLKHITRETTSGVEDIWEFYHKMYQEYLSALHLSQEEEHSSIIGEIRSRSQIMDRGTEIFSLSGTESQKYPKFVPCFAFLRCCFFLPCRLSSSECPESLSRGSVYSLRSLESCNSECHSGKRSRGKKLFPFDRDDIIERGPTYSTGETDQYMLQFLAALNLSKQEIDDIEIAAIVKDFNESIMGHRWISWSNLIRECAPSNVLYRLVRLYLENEKVELHDGNFDKVSQTLEAVHHLMQTISFAPALLSLRLGDDDIFPDVLPSLLLSLGKLSVSIILEFSLTHCLDMGHCLTQQESLHNVRITIYGYKFAKLDSLTQLLQCLHGTHCKLKLEITVHDLQNMISLAECFSNVTLPRETELCLRFLCVTPTMSEPLCQVLEAFPWHAPLSIAFSHTTFGQQVLHLQELVTDALRDARVGVTGAWLGVEAAAISSGDHYRRLADVITNHAPVVLALHPEESGDNVRLTLRGKKEQLERITVSSLENSL